MRLIKKFLIATIGLGAGYTAQAQMDLFPCNEANPELRALAHSQVVPRLYVHSCGGESMHHLATSFLKATGTPPPSANDPDDPNWGRYETWTCTYNPGNISDKDPKTAWVEGAEGHGIGELILVACLDFDKPLRLWNGYGKSDKLWAANGRVKRARLLIIRAIQSDFGQYGDTYGELIAIAQSEVTLQDLNGYQPLVAPTFERGEYFNQLMQQQVPHRYFLGIEILDVYPGTKYKDTCISEVGN